MHLSVIIPYFQREAGVLRRALQSVASQDGVYDRPDLEGLDLIVVDDQSPVSAASETDGIVWPDKVNCRVIRQQNSGPGGARNTGLDAAVPGSVVAFLDSDDEWMPDHLDRGIDAIALGYSVYACNWVPLGEYPDAISMPARKSLRLAPIEAIKDAGELVGDPLVSELSAPMCKLSGLIYDAGRFGGLRFDTRFRTASEDVLFINLMMAAQPRVLISTQPEVRSGKGVNIYESVEWGTPQSLAMLYDQTLATKLSLDREALNQEARSILRGKLAEHRNAFAANLWDMLFRARLPVRRVARHVLLDPKSLATVASYPLRRSLNRLGLPKRTNR